MMIFAALYFYFLIQMLMMSKWTDSLTMKEIKEKLNWVPSTVNEKTKIVKKKIEDGSITIKKWVKTISDKTSKNIQKWKDFVVETYNDIKSKITDMSTKISDMSAKMKEKWSKVKSNVNIDNNTLSKLIKSNKDLINTVTKLIDEYDKNLKLLEKINKNLSKKK